MFDTHKVNVKTHACRGLCSYLASATMRRPACPLSWFSDNFLACSSCSQCFTAKCCSDNVRSPHSSRHVSEGVAHSFNGASLCQDLPWDKVICQATSGCELLAERHLVTPPVVRDLTTFGDVQHSW